MVRKKKTAYQVFLKSPYWKAVKKSVLTRDKFQCMQCGKKRSLQVHHKSYKHLGNEHKHLTDLTTLCSGCHRRIHAKK